MPEQLNLSESAWAQLDLLQQHLNVILEVLDSSMHPLASAVGGEPSQALDHAGVEAEIAKSLKTGEVRVYRSGGVPVGIFPLRVARHIAGCLVVLPKPTRQAAAEPATEARIEGAGLLARTALEADLSLNDQLIDVRYRNRRVHGILKFLLQLGADPDNEREMMKAVIQAATVWFDADCRVYQRQPDDSFLLAAMLPGATEQRGGVRLEPMRVEKLVASRRLPSAGDLEELGLHGRRDEVLVLPVGPASRPVWLLVIAGTIDQEIELTFSAIARVLAGVLQTREVARVDRWQQRLGAFMTEPHRAPERVILSLLEALATGAGAVGARVTLIGPGESRALAALGQTAKPGQEKAGDEGISENIEVGPETRLRVTLWPAPGAARIAAADLRSWVTALRPWLLHTVSNLTEQRVVADPAFMSTFERRIQEEVERAKRFNLGLGLVVIGATPESTAAAALENLLDALRPDIRASDLTGRLSGDMVAIVLVHTEAVGADTVLTRVKRRLESMGSGRHKRLVHLGMAVYTPDLGSADSLIAEALRAGQRVELRN